MRVEWGSSNPPKPRWIRTTHEIEQRTPAMPFTFETKKWCSPIRFQDDDVPHGWWPLPWSPQSLSASSNLGIRWATHQAPLLSSSYQDRQGCPWSHTWWWPLAHKSFKDCSCCHLAEAAREHSKAHLWELSKFLLHQSFTQGERKQDALLRSKNIDDSWDYERSIESIPRQSNVNSTKRLNRDEPKYD